jgi:tetratricopeptide (TPR) repeat protein
MREMLRDNQGLVITAAEPSAVAHFDAAVTEWLGYKITAMKTLKQALERDADFCMAHCFRGYLFVTFNSAAVLGAAHAAHGKAAAVAQTASRREQRHVEALRYLLDGVPHKACACWEAILADYPVDIVALRMHHYTSFWSGYRQQLSAAPAAVLPAWDRSVPHYGTVLGMVAFGLEELGLYAQAERYGRDATAHNPDDLWAVHSVAHVMEMQQRAKDGLAWLDYTIDHFDDFNPFRGHIWWHRGLFLIEAGRFDEALSLYDNAIHDTASEFFLDVQNSVSFLARLEFNRVDVAGRWQDLADVAAANNDGHCLVFTDIHHIIALCKAQKFNEAAQHIVSMQDHASTANTHLASVIKDVGIPIGNSIIAHEKGDHEQALDLMLAHRIFIPQMGASNAQRDLLALYSLDMARRTTQSAMLAQLLQERDFARGMARR